MDIQSLLPEVGKFYTPICEIYVELHGTPRIFSGIKSIFFLIDVRAIPLPGTENVVAVISADLLIGEKVFTASKEVCFTDLQLILGIWLNPLKETRDVNS